MFVNKFGKFKLKVCGLNYGRDKLYEIDCNFSWKLREASGE